MEEEETELQIRLKQLEPLVQRLKDVTCPQTRLKLMGADDKTDDIIIRCLQLTGAEPLLPLLNLEQLREVDQFYLPIGGLLGYYQKVLQLIINKGHGQKGAMALSRAPGFDLDHPQHWALEEGLHALAELAEIYPIGGLATRLDYRNEKGQLMPAALLPFEGHTLLEKLIRDVEGREHLYQQVFGRLLHIPIALMTSDENEEAICELLQTKHWFNRPQESFFIFRQPSVPVLTEEGKWVLTGPSKLAMQPGGHGAIWQAALKQGVFDWFLSQGKHHLLIRQINNPLGGLDHALLSLIGLGKREKKTFGFLSCERDPKAAEGMLALVEEPEGYRISNIEYTEAAAYGVEDVTTLTANTNMLYVHLDTLMPCLRSNPLPGFLINMKETMEVPVDGVSTKQVMGGRLESTMQSISDHLKASAQDELPTFLVYQKRERTIASTKKKFSGSLPETPEGAFYSLLRNHYELLKRCGFMLPPLCSENDYLASGPSLIFYYHPRVGPLYSVMTCKLKGGRFAKGAELIIEPSDLFVEQLDLQGSLVIKGKGKCVLKNVVINNKGVNFKQTDFWKGHYERKEGATIILNGSAEFHAEGVEIRGNQEFNVPDQERWMLTQAGLSKKPLLRSTWHWRYKILPTGEVVCEFAS